MKIRFRVLTDDPGGPVELAIDTDRGILAIGIPAVEQGHYYAPAVTFEYQLVPVKAQSE